MKKIIIVALLLFVGYKLYSTGTFNQLPFLQKSGAFDVNGKAIVRLFVGPGCEAPCAEIESLLKNRKVEYNLVDIASPEGAKYGVHQYPLLQVGNDNAPVGNTAELIGILASHLGPEVLTRTENLAMQNHFDDKGRAMVVLYGTEWCAFCKKQRAFFESQGIPYVELDPEKSDSAKTAYTILRGDGYPMTYVGYRRFVGYNESGIKQAWRAIP